MIGKNGNQSLTHWTPQSCKKTTPAPTTTTTAAPTTTTMGDEEKAQAAEDNINLKQELQDLKQQYNAIGESMYEVVKDNVYHGFEAYLARKKESFYFVSHYLILNAKSLEARNTCYCGGSQLKNKSVKKCLINVRFYCYLSVSVLIA